MAESVTISTAPPDFKSMRFDLLREEGLKHLQNLAGKIWTDYNLSDPGVTILEALSYVITDLGYRTAYPIQDIVANNPLFPKDIKNFYTARQILPVYPVTFNDYRKLMIDCEITNSSLIDCTSYGVKNAWISISPKNELPIYLNAQEEKLAYSPQAYTGSQQINPKVLYDVLLELGSCDLYGDLNETTLETYLTVSPCAGTPSAFAAGLNGVRIKVKVEFPRWDDVGVNWQSATSIKNFAKKITLIFSKLPANYRLDDYGFKTDKDVYVTMHYGSGGLAPVVDTSCLEGQIDDLILNEMAPLYLQKVARINEVMAAVRQRLMANRNFCEDFFNITTLKVEEIAVCADIQIAATADVEQTEARIYYEIQKFLSPTVYFYTLEEMFEKGKSSEEIFDGPALQHGFIDDNELVKAKRREVIHVSDLINIIMDIEGVIAVKKLQIANIPQDNDDKIPTVSVRWCLDLAFEYNYIPRLSTELSKIIFYKDQLPFGSNIEEVDALLAELEDNDQPQKLVNPVLDIAVPEGEYKDIQNYVSVQDEFPLVYGIGSEGLPDSATTLRKAQAKQLKGFLVFFDQLLADYLAQLGGVKDLFSMSGVDENGDLIITQSYFTQSLFPSVTGISGLITDEQKYKDTIQALTEDTELFDHRRNKFLDHLMARFSEQFTDYAMMVYTLNGKKGAKELLVDKLELLNDYPEISSGRFKAFDYSSKCQVWSIDNVSGFDRRASLLNGISPKKATLLQFGLNFDLNTFPLEYRISETLAGILLKSPAASLNENELKLLVENVVENGFDKNNYTVIFTAGPNTYSYELKCGGIIIGLSSKTYLDTLTAEADITTLMGILSNEFYNNPESNRNNLECPINNYIDTTAVNTNMVPNPPTYTFGFTLYKNPFKFTVGNTQLLSGVFNGKGLTKGSAGILSVPATNKVRLSIAFNGLVTTSKPNVNLTNSSGNNDGDYLVTNVAVVAVVGGNELEVTLSPALPDGTGSTAPFGNLLFNKQTAAELSAEATKNKNASLFEILYTGEKFGNYNFTTSSPYKFNLVDRCNDLLATSVESDFNAALAVLTANHPGSNLVVPNATSIKITGNGSNDNIYTVNSATTDLGNIKVVVTNGSMQTVAGGTLSYDGSYLINQVNLTKRIIRIPGNFYRLFFAGDKIQVKNGAVNKGTYTIKSVVFSSGNSSIELEEKLNSAILSGTDQVYYVKEFLITDISNLGANSTITIAANGGIEALKEMNAFITSKFFANEGMHMVEHILLRPKINHEKYYPITNQNGLTTGISPTGFVEYTKFRPISSVITGTNNYLFVISGGNYTNEISPLSEIIVKGSSNGVYDKTYHGLSVSYDSGSNSTRVKVLEEIPVVSPAPGINGSLYFRKKIAISTILAFDTIQIAEANPAMVSIDYPAVITASYNNVNNGTFIIVNSSNSTDLKFSQALVTVKDSFLPVNINADCHDCQTSNPYSFIASVILPYWQGRFINQDFRQFVERSLRTECPAHIALNICWVSPDQMAEFEKAYKNWLIENRKGIALSIDRTEKLKTLIDTLVSLRTVYPTGVLHDCNNDPELTTSIVLNRTAIGTLQL